MLTISLLTTLFTAGIANISDINGVGVQKVYAEDTKQVINVDQLKYQIASDKNLQSNLGELANFYGFGWAGGTKTPYAGNDFDVYKDGDNYVMQAHYDKKDPYANGYWANKRLKIILSNFRYRIDSNSVKFDTPQVTKLDPEAVFNGTLQNNGDTKDTCKTTVGTTSTDTITHTTNYSFSEQLKLGSSVTVGVPAVSSSSKTIEFTFNTQQGWSDAKATSETKTFSCDYTSELDPHTERSIDCLLAKTQNNVSYTANAEMVFDVTFYNFLSYSYNSAHNSNRPFVTKVLGNGQDMSAMEAISDNYNNRNIPGYDKAQWRAPNDITFDWNVIEQHFGDNSVSSVIDYLRNYKFTFPISGRFTSISGSNIYVNAQGAKPAVVSPNNNPLALKVIKNNNYQVNVKSVSSSGRPVNTVIVPSSNPVSDGIYEIVSVDSGKALDVNGGADNNETNVQIWSPNYANNQKWKVISTGDGWCEIVPLCSTTNKCLDVYGASSNNETNVQIFTHNNGDNQKWRFDSLNDGSYKIVSKLDSNKCLDVYGYGKNDGTNVQLYTFGNGSNQKWKLVKLD